MIAQPWDLQYAETTHRSSNGSRCRHRTAISSLKNAPSRDSPLDEVLWEHISSVNFRLRNIDQLNGWGSTRYTNELLTVQLNNRASSKHRCRPISLPILIQLSYSLVFTDTVPCFEPTPSFSIFKTLCFCLEMGLNHLNHPASTSKFYNYLATLPLRR